MNDVQVNGQDSYPSIASLQTGDMFRYPAGRAVYMLLPVGYYTDPKCRSNRQAVHLGTGDTYTLSASKAVLPILPGTPVTITPPPLY